MNDLYGMSYLVFIICIVGLEYDNSKKIKSLRQENEILKLENDACHKDLNTKTILE